MFFFFLFSLDSFAYLGFHTAAVPEGSHTDVQTALLSFMVARQSPLFFTNRYK